ncbi:MAG: hypothetical protein NZN28_05190 [Meiothermus sp.]|nr:hypothetical protein [Meiothermus sp.]
MNFHRAAPKNPQAHPYAEATAHGTPRHAQKFPPFPERFAAKINPQQRTMRLVSPAMTAHPSKHKSSGIAQTAWVKMYGNRLGPKNVAGRFS